MNSMKKHAALLLVLLFLVQMGTASAFAAAVPRCDTPNYKVAFYAYDNYHILDENGKKSGYGYEMMEALSYYMQATFSYTGYDKTPEECVALLEQGDIDLYTAAKNMPERAEKFAFTTHPAITATTCLAVKVGNNTVVSGDYSTYANLRIGTLARHSYNDEFIAWANSKNFAYTLVTYTTQQALSEALIQGDVDAVLNSYIGTPKDEQIVETFQETPYYIMARKEDQALIDSIDAAMDRMNVELPNWRTTLYQKYYGISDHNTALTKSEQIFLKALQESNVVIRALANPNNAPYSWYENGEAHGIAVDIFKATAERLGLEYELIAAESRTDYQRYLTDDTDAVDIWLEVDGYYSGEPFKLTDVYLDTTASLLRRSTSSGKVQAVAVVGELNVDKLENIQKNWPNARIVIGQDLKECKELVLSGKVDGALLMTYTAQKMVQEDVQNRLRAVIVPGSDVELRMGMNSNCEREFCSIWKKTLERVSTEIQGEVVQNYTESNTAVSIWAYFFDHPTFSFSSLGALCALIAFIALYVQTRRSNRRYQRIAAERELALEQAKNATAAKEDFFSKMSHDIRTPLNVVLGMTQVARKYKNEPDRLQYALDSITSEGNYLLVLINSILDVNQLEHGQVELTKEPFNPAVCVRTNAEMLRTLADGKSQKLTVTCDKEDQVVVGDINRYSQIIINIISNAIKYTAPGGHISVSLECLDNSRCRFTCQDNGIGMTQEFAQHITEEYARAEDSRVSKTQGTGLGMAVVKGFVDLMGGTLQLKTAPDEGSTFIVEIPFAEATSAQKESILSPAPVEKAVRFAGKRALLVEDNALNAEIAIELLQSIGLSVDWAENGLLAVERLTASPPGTYSVIFMDMQMPVMDGITAARNIRASGHPDHEIPILAMTANTFENDRKLCAEAGMDGYISKPINIHEISAALERNAKIND